MSIRIKFRIDNVTIRGYKEKEIVINIYNGSVQAAKEDGTLLTKLKGGEIKKIASFYISCNQDKAKKILYLILLKNTLKNTVSDEKGEWNIAIENINEEDLEYGYWTSSLSFSNGDLLDEKQDLLINPTNIADGNPINQHNSLNNLDKYKDQLFQLTDLLLKIEKFFLNDFDLSSYTSLENDINELQSYVHNEPLNLVTDNAKQIIYKVDDLSGKKILKSEIDKWIDLLKEYRVWYQIIGLKTDNEIKEAKKNGFIILGKDDSKPTVSLANSSNDLELDGLNVITIKSFFPSPNGKYKGFDITQPQHKKEQIDRFRDKKYFGGTINGINYSNETQPNKCRGLKPDDFTNNFLITNYGGHLEDMLGKDGKIGKLE